MNNMGSIDNYNVEFKDNDIVITELSTFENNIEIRYKNSKKSSNLSLNECSHCGEELNSLNLGYCSCDDN